MSFNNWKARIAGTKVKTFLRAGPEDEGYYRKPISWELLKDKNGNNNGQKRVTDWVPVGYFLQDRSHPGLTGMYGLIGAGNSQRVMRLDELGDENLWSYACSNPISYEEWVRVADNGEPWADLPKPARHPMDESLRRTQATMQGADNIVSREDYQAEIEAELTKLPVKVATKEEAEAALGLKNRIAELRLEASKIGKSIYEPLHAAYVKQRDAWTPMVKAAEAAEKHIKMLVDTFSEGERQRAIKEKAEIEKRLQEEEGRNARAADRAIARGEPEALELEDIELPGPDVTPLTPTQGRAYKQELKLFVTIEDEAKVAAFFRGNPELVAVLQKLAERTIKLGQEVPGTATDRRYA